MIVLESGALQSPFQYLLSGGVQNQPFGRKPADIQGAASPDKEKTLMAQNRKGEGSIQHFCCIPEGGEAYFPLLLQ